MSHHPQLYDSLSLVYRDALLQASKGKGEQRHGSEAPFQDQVGSQICRHLGPWGLGFPLGQAAKKIFECPRLDDQGARHRELLGAMNYLAIAAIHNNMERYNT